MRNLLKSSVEKENDLTRYVVIGVAILILQILFHVAVSAKPLANQTDSIAVVIEKQLNSATTIQTLKYPATVKRFYTLTANQPNWIKTATNIRPTWEAMLLLDCIRQYGLLRGDFHPQALHYGSMHDALDTKHVASIDQKANFDILLTDAMLTLIYQLHFGKFNPKYTASLIDQGNAKPFVAEQILISATNSTDFSSSILAVQPQCKPYQQLQSYLRLLIGQYTCDSYEAPEAEVRKIALNLERLRWMDWENTYIHINIPNYLMTYQTADSTYLFKVVVGKASTPTPTLQSSVTYFNTAPDWRVPKSIFIKELLPKATKDSDYLANNHLMIYDAKGNYVKTDAASLAMIKSNPNNYYARQTAGCDNALGKVVFRFANPYDVYLHDSPDKAFFNQSKRAYSHGCIRVADAEQFAKLILQYDQQSAKIPMLNKAMDDYKPLTFKLNAAIPIKITYLTCGIEDQLLVDYADVYGLDRALEKQLFNPTK